MELLQEGKKKISCLLARSGYGMRTNKRIYLPLWRTSPQKEKETIGYDGLPRPFGVRSTIVTQSGFVLAGFAGFCPLAYPSRYFSSTKSSHEFVSFSMMLLALRRAFRLEKSTSSMS